MISSSIVPMHVVVEAAAGSSFILSTSAARIVSCSPPSRFDMTREVGHPCEIDRIPQSSPRQSGEFVTHVEMARSYTSARSEHRVLMPGGDHAALFSTE